MGAEPSEIKLVWLGSFLFRRNICCAAAFTDRQIGHPTVIPCGKGRGRRQWPVFTGTVSFGVAVSGSDGSDVRKEILLVRPLMSIWHWPNFLT